ncbi:MAG: hypothetical protein WCJ39_09840 [bacterium]
MVDLYNSTHGDDRNTTTNRLDTYNICDWYGVTCGSMIASTSVSTELYSPDYYVSRLQLQRNNLSGAIPESF